MSIALPPPELRNLLVIDYLLDHCSMEVIVKYFELADHSITTLVKCNTRFCTLLAKYLRSLQHRKNVQFYFNQKSDLHETSECAEIVDRILKMDCDNDTENVKHSGNSLLLKEPSYIQLDHADNYEMYVTMQMLNIKQSIYATSFDALLHVSIPASTKNEQLNRKLVSFQPTSTFLIESIDIELSIEKSQKNRLIFMIHEKPSIRWSKYAQNIDTKEEITTAIGNPSQGCAATNAFQQKIVNLCNFPRKIECKAWEGNYLIAIMLHCHREFSHEIV